MSSVTAATGLYRKEKRSFPYQQDREKVVTTSATISSTKAVGSSNRALKNPRNGR